ncbi:MAG: DUF4258 domain-containing protein [Chloroflexi bacterium]|nr:DUF4258 domain-containing protein [Chloroflexota bacterium]
MSHAERERESDKITIQEIEEAILSHQTEVIENYPEDARGKSCLILGFTEGGKPLHLVCGLGTEELVIITVYRPDPQQWIDWRVRRKAEQ